MQNRIESHRSSRRSVRALTFAALTAAALTVAAPAFAASGSGGGGTGGGGTGGGGGGGGTGGGGTTTSVGVIKPAVTVGAVCTGGTSTIVTVQKGNNKVVERVLQISGTTAGWWDLALTEDSTGRGLVVNGTGMNDLIGVTALMTVSTGSTLSVGTWNLTYTGTHRAVPGGPVLETCTAHLTVTAV